uniref:Uncharacterized protein n=1 Tax=Sphaerodactylus townsendi TaxID=933632 RepID=A0ACB8GE42_9SAUR
MFDSSRGCIEFYSSSVTQGEACWALQEADSRKQAGLTFRTRAIIFLALMLWPQRKKSAGKKWVCLPTLPNYLKGVGTVFGGFISAQSWRNAEAPTIFFLVNGHLRV